MISFIKAIFQKNDYSIKKVSEINDSDNFLTLSIFFSKDANLLKLIKFYEYSFDSIYYNQNLDFNSLEDLVTIKSIHCKYLIATYFTADFSFSSSLDRIFRKCDLKKESFSKTRIKRIYNLSSDESDLFSVSNLFINCPQKSVLEFLSSKQSDSLAEHNYYILINSQKDLDELISSSSNYKHITFKIFYI